MLKTIGKVVLHRHFLVQRLSHHLHQSWSLHELGLDLGRLRVEIGEVVGDVGVSAEEGESAVEDDRCEGAVGDSVHLHLI